jgi:hypothetical protein
MIPVSIITLASPLITYHGKAYPYYPWEWFCSFSISAMRIHGTYTVSTIDYATMLGNLEYS